MDPTWYGLCMVDSPVDAEHEPGWYTEAVTALCQAVESLRQRTAAELGISSTELVALRLICSTEGMSPRDIATELELTSGSVTPILDHLTQAGYVQRSAHPRDRRRVLVYAEPEGHRALAWANEQLDSVLRTVIAQWSDQDHAAVARFLTRAADALGRPTSGT